MLTSVCMPRNIENVRKEKKGSLNLIIHKGEKMAEQELLAIRVLSEFKKELDDRVEEFYNYGIDSVYRMLDTVYESHIRRLSNVVPKIEIKADIDLTKAENKVAENLGAKSVPKKGHFTEPL